MAWRKRFGLPSDLLVAWCSLFVCAQARPEDVLSGKWDWQAACDRGEFHGIMEINQQGNAFTGEFLQTNFWDKGTISNDVLNGRNMSFDRTYGLIEQHLSADLSDGNRKLSGPYESQMFGHCMLNGKKIITSAGKN
jgi:hypothetical protein